MFSPRTIAKNVDWLDETGVKIYTITTRDEEVEQSYFIPRLKFAKASRNLDWERTASFVIFHVGATCDYLVLAWWGNDNELFTSVSVKIDDQWIEDSSRYSFCLYDMEIMWSERNIYVKTMDCSHPSLEEYRVSR